MQGGWVEKNRTKSSISERSENSLIFDKLVVEGETAQRMAHVLPIKSHGDHRPTSAPPLAPPYAKTRVAWPNTTLAPVVASRYTYVHILTPPLEC